jgi:hypothetical protein
MFSLGTGTDNSNGSIGWIRPGLKLPLARVEDFVLLFSSLTGVAQVNNIIRPKINQRDLRPSPLS